MLFNLTTEQQILRAQGRLRRRFFVWADVKDADGLPAAGGFWDGTGYVSVPEFPGRIYNPTGLISVGPLRASIEATIEPMTITLSQADEDVINAVRAFIRGQEPIEVHLGLFDWVTRALVPPLAPWFAGVIDDIEWPTRVGAESEIKFVCESSARALTAKDYDTRSDECCKQRDPDDRFYEQTAIQAELQLHFGKQTSSKFDNAAGLEAVRKIFG